MNTYTYKNYASKEAAHNSILTELNSIFTNANLCTDTETVTITKITKLNLDSETFDIAAELNNNKTIYLKAATRSKYHFEDKNLSNTFSEVYNALEPLFHEYKQDELNAVRANNAKLAAAAAEAEEEEK